MMSIAQRAILIGGSSALIIASTISAYFEGPRNLVAFLDPINIPTICGGITHIDGKPVQMGMKLTDKKCEELELLEYSKALATVDRLTVNVVMGENPRAAFTSFTYNAGGKAFATSSMLRLARAGDIRGACDALTAKRYGTDGVCRGYGCGWAGGRQLKGLQKRREAERELCLTGLKP